MRFFDIYEHPRWGRQAVPLGFSWPAFMAPMAWAAAKGLGTLTLTLVVCTTLMFDFLEVATTLVQQPAAAALIFLVGYAGFGLRPGNRASSWLATKLREDGFQLRTTVAAADRSHALSVFHPSPALRQGRKPLVLLSYGAGDFPEYAFEA